MEKNRRRIEITVIIELLVLGFNIHLFFIKLKSILIPLAQEDLHSIDDNWYFLIISFFFNFNIFCLPRHNFVSILSPLRDT